MPSIAGWIGNSARPPGKESVAAAGFCPSALFTTSLTAPPVIVTCAVTCLLAGPVGARPEIQPRRAAAHCRTHQDNRPSVGECAQDAASRRYAGCAAALGRRGDPLVGRREREPHVLGEVHPVEVPRSADDAEVGEPRRSTPMRRAPRWPRGRARPRCGRCGIPPPRARASAGRGARGSAASARRRARRREARRPWPAAAVRQHEPACLRTVVSRAITATSGDERRAVPGHVRLLREGVDDERVAMAVADDARVEQARHRLVGPLALPPELGVALVADDDRRPVRAPAREPRAVRRRRARARRGCPGCSATRASSRQATRPDRRMPSRSPGEHGTHLVARVRGARMHDHVALAEPEQERQQGDELLRADGRQDVRRVRPVTPRRRANHSTIAARSSWVPTVCG